jgi:hypothetical protein
MPLIRILIGLARMGLGRWLIQLGAIIIETGIWLIQLRSRRGCSGSAPFDEYQDASSCGAAGPPTQ